MKSHHFLSLLFYLSIYQSFGQDKQKDYFANYRGYEYSLRHGIVSKMNLVSPSKKDPISRDQSLLQRRTDVQYEYIDIVKSSMNIPLSQCQDENGNTFITGSNGNISNHSGDITTVKIDQNGTIVWTVRIPSSNFTVNSGTTIALDDEGNIIVAGYIWNNDNMDVICSKISSSGAIIWQNTINNENNFEIPNAVFVSDTNEIFITGIAHANDSVTYYTLKLDAQGQLLWEQTETGFPESTWNEPKALTQDNDGNVIISGYGYDQGEKSAIVTIKYTPDGQLLWKRVKAYTVSLEDTSIVSTDALPYDFTMDSLNNIYITGIFKTEFASSTTTFKYDANGVEIWNLNYQVDEENTYAHRVLLHQNVLYVGGIHYGNSLDGYFLRSLNLDGIINWTTTTEDLIWISKFNMFEHNNAIILNSISYTDIQVTNNKINTTAFSTAGSQINSSNYAMDNETLGMNFGDFFDSYIHNNNAVITVSSYYSSIGNVYETLKLDINSSASTFIWSAKLQEDNATSTNVLETVTDSNNNVYSLVSNFYVTNNQINQKSYLIKYNDSGEVVWNKLLDDSPFLVSLRIAIDSNANLITLLGKPLDDITTEVTLKKIASDGSDVWNTSVPLELSGNLFVKVNNSDDIYIIATVVGNNNSTAVRSVKISESGSVLSSNNYQPADEVYTKSFANKVIIDENENLIIGGGSGFFNTSTFQNIYSPSLLKVTPNGNVEFYNVYNLLEGESSYIVDMDTNSNGYTLAVDNSNLITFNNKIKLMTVNQLGGIIWEHTFEASNSSNYVYKLLKGNESTVYTVGARLADEQNIQVIKWELNENATSSVILANFNYYQDCFIDAESIYILSQNQESLHFPRRVLRWIGPFISAQVTKLNYDLVQTEVINMIGENYSLYEPKQFIPMANDNLLISGRMFDEQLFFEGLYFFNVPFSPILSNPEIPGNQDFITLSNYPNPVINSQTTIGFNLVQDASISVNLYDLNGKLIEKLLNGTYPQGSNAVEIILPNLMDGVYVLQLSNGKNNLYRKIVVSN
ncbi:MAG: T9SS type A sorting domain-containing protein [Flavobacterium sp. JAD_PAG50586_2]|nr:MAG: T9SS type A sorting domain-containing protein [Flavobacterium sp. JAD_PAG50586_2]